MSYIYDAAKRSFVDQSGNPVPISQVAADPNAQYNTINEQPRPDNYNAVRAIEEGHQAQLARDAAREADPRTAILRELAALPSEQWYNNPSVMSQVKYLNDTGYSKQYPDAPKLTMDSSSQAAAPGSSSKYQQVAIRDESGGIAGYKANPNYGGANPVQPQPREIAMEPPLDLNAVINAGRGSGGLIVEYGKARYEHAPAYSNASPDMVKKADITQYVPYGDRTAIELQNTKKAFDKNTGEIGYYQVPINPDTGKPRTGIYGAEAGGMLIAGGGRNAAQSGMFSTGVTGTPDIRLQYNPKKYAETANVGLADIIRTSPNEYSRLGAEAYGGMVLPLDSRTIKSTGAQYGRFPDYSGNLANLVDPYGVNKGKAELPGAAIPWSIPLNAPPSMYVDYKGLQGEAPTGYNQKASLEFAGNGLYGFGSNAGILNPTKPADTLIIGERTGARYGRTIVTGDAMKDSPWLAKLPAPFLSTLPSGQNQDQISTPSVQKNVVPDNKPSVWEQLARSPILIGNAGGFGAMAADQGYVNSVKMLPQPFKSTYKPSEGLSEYDRAVLGGYSGGLLGRLAFGEKAPQVIKGAIGSGVDTLTSLFGGWTPVADRMRTEAPGLPEFRSQKSSLESSLTSLSEKGKQQYGIDEQGRIKIDTTNKEALAYQSQYNALKDQYGSFMESAKGRGLVINTKSGMIENPDLTYDYGEFSKWGIGAGKVVRETLGFDRAQLEQFGTNIEQKKGLGTIPEKLIYGTGYTLSTRPEKIVSSYIGGAMLVFGGEALGGMYEGSTLAARAGAAALAHPAAAAAINTAVRLGVPAVLLGATHWSASEGMTASPEKTTINYGKIMPEAAGMLYGGASAYVGVRGIDRGLLGFKNVENTKKIYLLDESLAKVTLPEEYNPPRATSLSAAGKPRMMEFNAKDISSFEQGFYKPLATEPPGARIRIGTGKPQTIEINPESGKFIYEQRLAERPPSDFRMAESTNPALKPITGDIAGISPTFKPSTFYRDAEIIFGDAKAGTPYKSSTGMITITKEKMALPEIKTINLENQQVQRNFNLENLQATRTYNKMDQLRNTRMNPTAQSIVRSKDLTYKERRGEFSNQINKIKENAKQFSIYNKGAVIGEVELGPTREALLGRNLLQQPARTSKGMYQDFFRDRQGRPIKTAKELMNDDMTINMAGTTVIQDNLAGLKVKNLQENDQFNAMRQIVNNLNTGRTREVSDKSMAGVYTVPAREAALRTFAETKPVTTRQSEPLTFRETTPYTPRTTRPYEPVPTKEITPTPPIPIIPGLPGLPTFTGLPSGFGSKKGGWKFIERLSLVYPLRNSIRQERKRVTGTLKKKPKTTRRKTTR